MNVQTHRQRIAPRFTVVTAPLVLLLLCTPAVRGQTKPSEGRLRLIGEISKTLLGSENPVAVNADADHGWRTVVLAAPGTPLSPLMTAFDAQGSDTANVAQLLENINLFDRPLIVRNGIAQVGQKSLGEIWDDVLIRTMPRTLIPASAKVDDEVTEWLFKKADRVDQARGVRYEREPSQYLGRYREYDALYQLIIAAQTRDDGSWRLHPRLSQFSSLAEARTSINEDWVKFGYKVEIESARQAFAERANGSAWTAWTDARATYDAFRAYTPNNRWVSQSFLFPPPPLWLGMGTWLHMEGSDGNGGKVTYQLARIRIERPWLMIDGILSGRIALDKDAVENRDFVISDGSPPTGDQFPAGSMSVFPEELLIVRQISFRGGADNQPREHPLALFAFPEATNLIGYVVRVLPKTPR